jgi:hypothetical protein
MPAIAGWSRDRQRAGAERAVAADRDTASLDSAARGRWSAALGEHHESGRRSKLRRRARCMRIVTVFQHRVGDDCAFRCDGQRLGMAVSNTFGRLEVEMKDKITAVQVIKNWAKLGVLVGILPWSYYYMTVLAPVVNHALGIDQLKYVKVGFYLIPIIAPPLLLFWFLSRNDPDEAR